MLRLLSWASVLALGLAAHAQAVQQFRLDTKQSKIVWTGKKITQATHTGTIHFSNGTVSYDDKGKPTTAAVIADMTSLKNLDVKKSSDRAKLVGHLKSDDFFGVAKHKTAKLVVTKFTAKGKGKYDVWGNLTIKNKTNPVKFTAHETVTKKDRVVKADLTFDRSKFDVRYGSNTFFDNLGNKAIYNDIDLKVTLHLVPMKKTMKKS